MAALSERFEMRLDEETLERVDMWRAEQPDSPSRSEAMRRLIEFGMGRTSGELVRFTDGERLLLLMMRDLYHHLKVRGGEVDPDFIADAIFAGHTWALSWEMTGLFHRYEDDPQDVKFVVDVLDMWEFIERGYEGLSEEDRATLKQEAEPFGEHVRFPGFDGNNEGECFGIARFLVEKMDRFSAFKGRKMNSHSPQREAYGRMLRAFDPVRTNLVGRELTRTEIATILKERARPR